MSEPRRMRGASDPVLESELQLRAMANNLPGGMVYQVDTGPDGRSRRLTYFSRGIETLHEIPLSELTEDSKRIEDSSFVYEAIDLEYRQMVAEAEARSVASMTPFSVDVPVTLPSGKKGWRHFTSAPRRMPDGRLIWDGLEIDITARKQAEEDRARLQEQLLQTQKIESIGQLAGGIAHDFNNMLSVILGHSEMALGRLALEGIDSDNPIFVHLKNILSAAERSAELTRQLLTFARKQPSRPRDIDLNARVSTLHPMLLQLIGEGIELVWTPSEEVGHVNIDPSQLDQILVNLCVNARDAIGDGGRTGSSANPMSGLCSVFICPGDRDRRSQGRQPRSRRRSNAARRRFCLSRTSL